MQTKTIKYSNPIWPQVMKFCPWDMVKRYKIYSESISGPFDYIHTKANRDMLHKLLTFSNIKCWKLLCTRNMQNAKKFERKSFVIV